jgi:hypothetical protein
MDRVVDAAQSHQLAGSPIGALEGSALCSKTRSTEFMLASSWANVRTHQTAVQSLSCKVKDNPASDAEIVRTSSARGTATKL